MLQMQIAQKMCEKRVLKHKADVADAYHTQKHVDNATSRPPTNIKIRAKMKRTTKT